MIMIWKEVTPGVCWHFNIFLNLVVIMIISIALCDVGRARCLSHFIDLKKNLFHLSFCSFIKPKIIVKEMS